MQPIKRIVVSRSNPGRPTIKESNRRLSLSFKLSAIPVIQNPDTHLTIWADVQFEFPVGGMPLDLNTSVTARYNLRCNNIVE